MEDSDWSSELWNELERKAREAPSEAFKEKLFPVEFRARTPIETFRSLLLDGYLPLFFYILFLTAWGSNFSHHHPPYLALLLMLPVGLCLSWTLAPLFRFPELRSLRDIVPLFFLGLLVPIPYSFFSALQGTRWSRSFAAEFAAVLEHSSAPTTHLPLFALSLGVAWVLKFWTSRVQNDAPWFQAAPKARLRRTLAYSLLSTPFWLYGMCLLGSQPSRAVQDWRDQDIPQRGSSSPWLPADSALSKSAWTELEKLWGPQSGPGTLSPKERENLVRQALENLQLGYHQGAWMLESLERDLSPALRARLLVLSIPTGLTENESLLKNWGLQRLREIVESRSSEPAELQELVSQLRLLQESFPEDKPALEALLRHLSSRAPKKPFNPFSLNWVLAQSGYTPRALSDRYQLHHCIELWLDFLATGDETVQRKLSQDIVQLTSPWARSSLDYLELRRRYWKALDFYRTALELQLYKRQQGHYPPSLAELGLHNSSWLYIHGDGETYPLTVLRDPENGLEQVRFDP